MILTVTLNPAIDKTVQENKIYLSAGGKGLNVSRTLKVLGQDTVATGFLGGSSGYFIQKELNKEHIKNDFFFIKGKTRTNLTVIHSRTDTITRVLERGPRISTQELKGFKKKFISLLPKCSWVIFSGSTAQNLPASIYKELITIIKQKNIKIALDTSGQPLKIGLQAKPFLIKPNLEEAQSVIGHSLNTMSKLQKAVKYFHRKGVKIVIISLGKKGALGSDGKNVFQVSSPKLKCKNNVGCGDALLAGFIVGYEKGKNLKEALCLAVACGAANALSLQPGLVHKQDINKFISKMLIKKVV